MIGITPEWRRSREICARLIPHTTSVHNVAIVAALLAEHDRRVSELLGANTAEVEHRRVAEDEREEAREVVRALTAHNVATSAERDAVAALAERMWPIVDAVCREWLNGSRDTLADDERYFAAHLRHRVGRAAAALVREREEKTT